MMGIHPNSNNRTRISLNVIVLLGSTSKYDTNQHFLLTLHNNNVKHHVVFTQGIYLFVDPHKNVIFASRIATTALQYTTLQCC